MRDRKLLILGLDGTLRQPVSGKWAGSGNQIVIPEVKQVLDAYHDRGWTVIAVSNQAGIAAKRKTQEACILEMQEFLGLFSEKLSLIYICPNFSGSCAIAINQTSFRVVENNSTQSFRLPSPGMIQLAVQELQPVDTAVAIGSNIHEYIAATIAEIPFLWA
jgi:D-glycero-D-manno-heptose 1,7-bisphosphate phosphatase